MKLFCNKLLTFGKVSAFNINKTSYYIILCITDRYCKNSNSVVNIHCKNSNSVVIIYCKNSNSVVIIYCKHSNSVVITYSSQNKQFI